MTCVRRKRLNPFEIRAGLRARDSKKDADNSFVLIPLRSGQDYEPCKRISLFVVYVLIPLRSGQDYEKKYLGSPASMGVLIPLRSGQDYERAMESIMNNTNVLIPLRSGQDYELITLSLLRQRKSLNPFEIRAGLRGRLRWSPHCITGS